MKSKTTTAAAAAATAAAVEINSEMEEAEVEEPTTLQSEELSCEKYSFQAVQHLKELEVLDIKFIPY